jgi:hypothetical protein
MHDQRPNWPRLKDIYAKTSDIIHVRPESFKLYPVTVGATGEKRRTALSLGWSEHLAREAVSRMLVLHSIFATVTSSMLELDGDYFKHGEMLVDDNKVRDNFVCRGYVPRESG